MNYIPGFSKYLETSVPRYAIGGRVMDGERMMYDMDRYGEPMMYDMGGYGDGDTRGYSEPYQYTPPIEQYMPVEQPMMYGGYDMGGYNELPYGGGGMLPAPVEQPYQQAAVEPMTTEAVPAEVPFDPNTFDFSKLDLSGLNNLYGMNFGSNFGGGPMGGIYQADPNLQYIGAPLSNKGNPTSQTGGNTFAVRADQPVRLVDHRTNQIVFEGTGFDAARKATELGQGLTDQFGRKANYSIQTADPTGNYSTVAYEKKNKSTLGKIAGAVGTALPLATMFIPGLNVLGTIAAGAGLGGAGAALRGDNILKGVAMGGLSAAGGQVLGPALEAGGKFGTALAPKLATAVGTGLGSTAGGLATGQSLKNALLGGVASGALSYVAPTVANELGLKPINLNGTKGTSGSSGMTADGGLQVTASTLGTPSIGTTLGGSPNKIQQALAEKPYDGLTVTGSRLGNAFGVNLGGNQFGAPGEDVSAFDRLTDTADPNDILVKASPLEQAVPAPVNTGLSPDVLAGIAEFEKNPIISEGSKIEQATPVSVPVTSGLSPDVLAGIAEFEKNPIISEGSKIEQPTDTGGLNLDLGVIDRVSGMENYKEPIVVEGSKIERPEPTSVSVMPPLDPLPPLDLKPDPALTDEKKLGLEEYLRIASLISGLVGGGGGGSGQTGTYGGGGTGRLNPIFSAKLPSAGGLGAIGATRTARPMGDQDWLTYGTRPELNFFDYASQANPAPITTPIPNEPRGPSMYAPDVDNMRFAKGGSSKRSEFAVNGPGTGRSDDIPAVLSDGEYVIDAETVALLGDGSNKAGAKKLDELRVKVRKHKGQKLAKGRFSANAKKAEAYLSGGRI
jgi:hypothetical protein